MRHSTRIASAALALLGGVTACAAGATITSGGVHYSIAPPPSTGTGWGPASNLEASALAADQLYQDWWWLRAGNETRESALAGAGAYVQPDAATLRFTSTHAGLSATATWTVLSGAAGEGELRATLRLTNPGNTAVTVRAFHYADIDVNGTYEDDVADVLGPTLVQFRDLAPPSGERPYTVRYGASAGAQFGLGQNGSLIASLTDSAQTTLNSALGGYAGGSNDLAGGWQWTITLGAHQEVEVSAFVALVPAPAGLGLLSLAGLAAMARPRRARA